MDGNISIRHCFKDWSKKQCMFLRSIKISINSYEDCRNADCFGAGSGNKLVQGMLHIGKVDVKSTLPHEVSVLWVSDSCHCKTGNVVACLQNAWK